MLRPLSKELQKKAQEELNEVPGRIKEDLDSLKQWISQQPHLNARTDDQWLMAFLRSSKFSLEKAKSKVECCYTLKTLWPTCIAPRDPFSEEIQALLNKNFLLPLPQLNPSGPLIILNVLKHIDLNVISLDAVVAIIVMLMMIMMKENDNLVVSGLVVINDCQNTPLSNILHLTPTYVKKLSYTIKNCCCYRIKGVYMFNTHAALDAVVNAAKSVLPQKIKQRFYVHSWKNIDNLYEQIPKKYLPKEYGGENGTVDEIGKFWKAKFESYADWFNEDAKYCTNEELRINKEQFDDFMFSGVDGSFRKLTID